MISNISVKNFQSLRSVSLELGRFTVIIGESGCGKSAFIRSVMKMTQNAATKGEEWSNLPPGVSNAEVGINVDGHVVVWQKGTSNRYVVDGATLTKVGKGCPDEVQDVLKMREIVFDDSTRYHLNFHEQFDMPFLLSDSGSRVAKILGDITNVNILYAANREAGRLKGQSSRTLSVREGDLGSQMGLVADYRDLPMERERAKQLKVLRGVVDQQVSLYKEIISLLTRMQQLHYNMTSAQQDMLLLVSAELASDKQEACLERLGASITISKLLGRLVPLIDAQRVLSGTISELRPLQKVDVQGVSANISLLVSMQLAIDDMGSSKDKLAEIRNVAGKLKAVQKFDTTVLQDSVTLSRDISGHMYDLEELSSALVDAGLGKITAAKDRDVAVFAYNSFLAEHPSCPLCGNPLPHEEV